MKISYIISHGGADTVSVEHDGGDNLTLKFEPKYKGTVTVGTSVFTVKNGEVKIPIAAMPEGKIHPKLECEVGVITVPPLTKRCREVIPKETDAETVKRLVMICHLLEKRLSKQEETLSQLVEKCKGHDIFNF